MKQEGILAKCHPGSDIGPALGRTSRNLPPSFCFGECVGEADGGDGGEDGSSGADPVREGG